MKYLFGQYVFNICADPELLKCVERRFSSFIYVGTAPESATLYIHNNSTDLGYPAYFHDSNGWYSEHFEHFDRVTYHNDHQVLFSIDRYINTNIIDICVYRSGSKCTLIALQHAVMMALSSQCIGLHGVTLICKDEVVILSAPSGTGKTTLARLLHQYYHAAIFNGDFALLDTKTAYGVLFEPTPFCGSSGICINQCLPVGRIVLLEQASENHWHTLDTRNAIVRIMSNVFVPKWDLSMTQSIQNSVLRLVDTIPVNVFAFSPTRDAADLFYHFATK